MCGIIGVFNDPFAGKKLVVGMQTIQHRGTDQYWLYAGTVTYHAKKPVFPVKKTQNAIGHCLHSIVSYQEQPLVGKGALVANCELYNWKELAKKHKIDAQNYAELLFKLLEKTPSNRMETLLAELDGDYAFAYWKENRVFLCRDPVGVKPIWYALENNRFGFASEAKALYAMGFSKPVEQNPRHLFCYDLIHHRLDNRSWFEFTSPVAFTPDTEHTLLEFEKIFLNAVKKRIPAKPFGILFSGGIDSVIIAAACIDLASKKAHKKGCKVVFSGLGSDDLFGGYARQEKSPQNAYLDSISYLRKAYEKDLYRDDVLTMHHHVELRVPYYDRELIPFALQLPDTLKISAPHRKVILRKLAHPWKLSPAIENRPKKAGQYGSNADKTLEKIAKKEKYPSKSAYLASLGPKTNIPVAALISGGKDSWLAATILAERNYPLSCLVSLQSQNPDSYMFHTPNISAVKLQARASRIPLVVQTTPGTKEKELDDLRVALVKAKEKYGIQGVVNGALYSNYQRSRIEKICDELGLKSFSPLWHVDQTQELVELLSRSFSLVFSSIACQGLTRDWLGKPLDPAQIAELSNLHKKLGVNVAGEGGEYESLVLDCPLFSKKIRVDQATITMQNENTDRK